MPVVTAAIRVSPCGGPRRARLWSRARSRCAAMLLCAVDEEVQWKGGSDKIPDGILKFEVKDATWRPSAGSAAHRGDVAVGGSAFPDQDEARRPTRGLFRLNVTLSLTKLFGRARRVAQVQAIFRANLPPPRIQSVQCSPCSFLARLSPHLTRSKCRTRRRRRGNHCPPPPRQAFAQRSAGRSVGLPEQHGEAPRPTPSQFYFWLPPPLDKLRRRSDVRGAF